MALPEIKIPIQLQKATLNVLQKSICFLNEMLGIPIEKAGKSLLVNIWYLKKYRTKYYRPVGYFSLSNRERLSSFTYSSVSPFRLYLDESDIVDICTVAIETFYSPKFGVTRQLIFLYDLNLTLLDYLDTSSFTKSIDDLNLVVFK